MILSDVDVQVGDFVVVFGFACIGLLLLIFISANSQVAASLCRYMRKRNSSLEILALTESLDLA